MGLFSGVSRGPGDRVPGIGRSRVTAVCHSRFLTDWSGPTGVVRRIQMAMRDNVRAGDDMILTGTVTKKHIQSGEGRVDVEVVISTQDGPVSRCQTTVVLPFRY